MGSWKHCTGSDKFRCIFAHWSFVFPAFQEDRQHFDTPLWGSIDLPEGLCRQLEFEWIWVNCWCEVDGSHWQEAHNIALWDSPDCNVTKWTQYCIWNAQFGSVDCFVLAGKWFPWAAGISAAAAAVGCWDGKEPCGLYCYWHRDMVILFYLAKTRAGSTTKLPSVDGEQSTFIHSYSLLVSPCILWNVGVWW